MHQLSVHDLGPHLGSNISRYEGGSYVVKIVIGAEFPLQPPRAVRALRGTMGTREPVLQTRCF